MPSVNWDSTGTSVFEFLTVSGEFKDSFFGSRLSLREKVKKSWPEFFDGSKILFTDPIMTEIRTISVNPEEQTGVAEGILKYCKSDAGDSAKEAAIKMAKDFKVFGWVSRQLSKDSKPFSESDESVESDQ